MVSICMGDDEPIYTIGHKNPDTDSVCAAIGFSRLKNALGENLVQPARAGALNDETIFILEKFGLDAPALIEDASGKRLMLLDHNEVMQAVDRLDEAEIIEVIDHHKIGDIQTPYPIYFRNEPVGSSCTIVAKMFREYGVDLDEATAGALLSGILSDTVVFRSVTCTEEDRAIAETLAGVAGITDTEKFGIEVKKAKSSIKDKDAETLITSDFKEFDMSGRIIGIGQIEIIDRTEADEKRGELLSKMNELKDTKGYNSLILMVTDILNEVSELLVVSDNETEVGAAFNSTVEDCSMVLHGVMSRKTQVVPPLELYFRKK